MHGLQKSILALAQNNQLNDKNLREIANCIGVNHLQKVKHHLGALIDKNFLYLDENGNYQVTQSQPKNNNSKFINIPIYGLANCGLATLYAHDNIEGYMSVAKSLLPPLDQSQLIILKAVGDSMTKADIAGDNICHGDYLIVNTKDRSPQDGDYILAVINNMASIKRYTFDQEKQEIRLISESARNIPPIIAKEHDDFLINGKIIKVVK